jgi:hypothetical protein
MAQLGSRVKPRVDRRRGSRRVRALRSSAGNVALQAADGYFRIFGRVNDVINIAGHRLGTKELESASLTVGGRRDGAACGCKKSHVLGDGESRLRPGIEPWSVVHIVLQGGEERLGGGVVPGRPLRVPATMAAMQGDVSELRSAFGQRRGDLDQLGVERLRRLAQDLERFALADAAALHQHSLGLPDHVAAAYRFLELRDL